MTGGEWVRFSQVCPNCGNVFGWDDVIVGSLGKLSQYMWHHKDCNDPTGVETGHERP